MEEKINVAKILKDKPVNTKLYSPLYGDVYFSYIGVRNNICVLHHRFTLSDFFYNGRYTAYKESEIMLFPSKDMRDWSKFAWKRGDVLISDCGFVRIFKEWASDDYTRFDGCYFDGMPNAETAKYSKLDNNTAYGYIRELENRCGGKLNLETLEIEKQTEFKDGDIVFVKSYMLGINTSSMIAIFRKGKEIDKYKFSPALCESNEHDTYLREDPVVLYPSDINIFRPATDSERQKLFDSLEKKNKAWDAEKKQIVDIKKELQFKPFEKVLVRDSYDDMWRASFFSHIKEDDGRYVTTGLSWKFCIPYEGNENLLGTTDNFE